MNKFEPESRMPTHTQISRLVCLVILVSILAGCTRARRQATPTATVPALPGTAQPSPTTKAQAIDPTAGEVATPTPITVSTPFVPTSLKFPDAQYSLAREMIIGPYAIRMWANTGADPSGFDSAVTIVAAGQPPVLIEQASGLDDLTGTDITGEGHPDVIVYTSTGEARCCSTVLMYDLGPTMVKVLETSTSECDGRFEDLDADGVYEFLTCTSLSVYPACCSAETPKVKVILQYQSGRGYVPASPRFAQFYADDIARDTQVAEQKTPNPSCESDGANKCTVLPLVLDYLYAGLPEPAWAELYRLYTSPDVETFRAEIQSAVEQSPLYAPH